MILMSGMTKMTWDLVNDWNHWNDRNSNWNVWNKDWKDWNTWTLGIFVKVSLKNLIKKKVDKFIWKFRMNIHGIIPWKNLRYVCAYSYFSKKCENHPCLKGLKIINMYFISIIFIHFVKQFFASVKVRNINIFPTLTSHFIQ